jgi:hypothetical protein
MQQNLKARKANIKDRKTGQQINQPEGIRTCVLR